MINHKIYFFILNNVILFLKLEKITNPEKKKATSTDDNIGFPAEL